MSRIGIKLDGVLIDKVDFQMKNGLEYFDREKKSIQLNVSSFRTMFSCNEQEKKAFWKKYYLKYCLSAECEKDAKDVLDALRGNYNEVYLFVTREETLKNSLKGFFNRKLLFHWLKKNGIECDGVIFCHDDEISSASQYYDLDIVVEDKISDAINISNTVSNVLLFDRPYNKGLEQVKNISRVKGFREVYSETTTDSKVRGLRLWKSTK